MENPEAKMTTEGRVRMVSSNKRMCHRHSIMQKINYTNTNIRHRATIYSPRHSSTYNTRIQPNIQGSIHVTCTNSQILYY